MAKRNSSVRSGKPRATRARSFLKALTYRVVVVVLDFTALYLLTGRLGLATAFTVVSNVYTSIAYYAHERVWSGISWGLARGG